MLFSNTDFTGGFGGTQIGEPPHLFGLNIDAASHPTRYGLFALGCLIVVGAGRRQPAARPHPAAG